MPKPNSIITKIRRELANRLQPCPDKGEAWCVNCTLNSGRTAVLSADGISPHTLEHYRINHEDHISILAAWPSQIKE
jgi:hypothetical protein